MHVLPCVLLGHTKLICCHICVSCLLRDMACQAPCECLPMCVSTGSVWQAKERPVKECDSGASYRGHHPKDPSGGLFNSTLHTHTYRGRYAIYRRALRSPPAPSSPFFSRSHRIWKQTWLKRRINEININILGHWQACKLKSGDGALAFLSEETGLGSKWTNERGFQIGTGVCWRARVEPCVRVSAVCSDQTHWCVIGSPLSRWPLRLNVCRGGGQEEVALMIMRYRWHTDTHTHWKYFV